MTAQVLKSQIKDEGEFRALLERLIQAKIAHLDITDGTPPPTDAFLDQFIRRAVTGPNTRDDFSLDYEVVDDTPPPPPPPAPVDPILAAVSDLRQQEQAEIAALVPPTKVRLLEMDYQRAARVPPEDRTPEQDKAISDYSELHQRIEEIQYAYAQREAAL